MVLSMSVTIRARSGIALHHPNAKVHELFRALRRRRVVRPLPAGLRGETEGERHVEAFKRPHLTIEPRVGVRSKAVRPAQTSAKTPHPEPLHPPHSVIETRIIEVEPLADPERGSVVSESLECGFRLAVSAHESHVVVTIVRRTLGFTMPRRRGP